MATSVFSPIRSPRFHEVQRLYDTAEFDAAADAGWELLREDPRDAAVLNLLALAEHRRGRHQAGVVLLQRAVKADPENFVLWNHLGNLLYSTGALDAMDEADAAYAVALRLNDRCAEAYSNRGALAYKRGEHEGSRGLLDQALAIRPEYPEALYNLGNTLVALGKFQKALRRYEQAAELQPEYASAHFNLGITRLLLGDMQGGWPGWEWRWRSTLAPFKREFTEPQWTGELLDENSLHKKVLLLYAEQGVGDTIQFLRYLPLVRERGARIVLEVQPALLPLLKDHPGAEMVVAQGQALPTFAVQCPLMSLPAIFRTTLATIPAPDGFLACKLSGRGMRRVGLVWAGNPKHERDHDRSISLRALAPLMEIAGLEWFSLQKGEAAAQLSAGNSTFAGVVDLAADFRDYADTARAIAGLDLVITVDTSVAHLAGSMGKPVWILLHWHPDWRWLLKRRESPWYPSARLFRQSERGDWDGVVAGVGKALEKAVASSRNTAASIVSFGSSCGEVCTPGAKARF